MTPKTIFADQKDELDDLISGDWCHRSEERLVDLDSRMAQLVIGVGRSGKSILCVNVIKGSGEIFAYVNFEDEKLVKATSDDFKPYLDAFISCMVTFRMYSLMKYRILKDGSISSTGFFGVECMY